MVTTIFDPLWSHPNFYKAAALS